MHDCNTVTLSWWWGTAETQTAPTTGFYHPLPQPHAGTLGKITDLLQTKYKLILNFIIFSPPFLLQRDSCLVSTLGGFLDHAGYSPEQPGLATLLTLLGQETAALVRSLLISVLP